MIYQIDISKQTRREIEQLPGHMRQRIKREIAQLGQLKLDDVFPLHRFLTVRAKPDHPDAWLTNRLISDFVPSDFVSRYVFNKQGFYQDYAASTDLWRSHVVATLKTTYLKDKEAFRTRLYGLTD